MKKYLLIAAIAAGAVVWCKCRKSKTADGGEISLYNIRQGITNGWYTAKIAEFDGKYYVQLSGKDTDGNDEVSVKEISKQTYDVLKSEGIADFA